MTGDAAVLGSGRSGGSWKFRGMNAMSSVQSVNQPGDLLDMAYINSLPQPIILIKSGGWDWPVNDFEVATGLFRIDVMGKLEVRHIGEAFRFRDADGKEHRAGDFYADPESWETRSE